MTSEEQARKHIDALLAKAGWHICDVADANIHAAKGVAIREFPLDAGFGFAGYLLYVDGKACGVIEAKKEGMPLTGVEIQSGRYAKGLPASLPAWRRPLPFIYETTGIETHFTNGLDPAPRARATFAFHQPAMLEVWLKMMQLATKFTTGPSLSAHTADDAGAGFGEVPGGTFLARMAHLPPLVETGLWPAQIIAIKNLEQSLAANKPRALIQMATGSGKTFTSINFISRSSGRCQPQARRCLAPERTW